MKLNKQAQKTTTMVDVAREAGVSLKTVSRVLNKEDYVSENTRDTVLVAANKLGYKLNQAARTLRSGAAQIIALLVDNPSRSYLGNVHFGALEKCHELSMQLILDESPDGVEDVKRLMQNISPAGFILTPPLCDNPEVIAFLNAQQCPYVLVSPMEPETARLTVTMDDERAALEMTEYLLSLGHKYIGFVKGHPDHGASQKRLDGYYNAHKKHNVPINEELIVQGYFNYASGLECTEKLLDLDNPPTAIFTSNDDMAAAAIAAAYKRNIAIPSKLSIVGFDDTIIASIISPQLTTVRQPISELAATAVELLSQDINHNYSTSNEVTLVTLSHALIERSSSGEPSNSNA